MTPGDIVMMLNEMGGMRVQATSPSMGAATVRIQGMRGRYTRVLFDGLPLAGQQVGGLGPAADSADGSRSGRGDQGRRRRRCTAPARWAASSTSSRGVRRTIRCASSSFNQSTVGTTDGVGFFSDGWPNMSAHRCSSAVIIRRRTTSTTMAGMTWPDIRAVSSVRACSGTTARGEAALGTIGVTRRRTARRRRPGRLAARRRRFGHRRIDRHDARSTSAARTRRSFADRYVLTARAGTLQRHDHVFGTTHERDRHTNVFAEAAVRGARGRHTWVGGVAFERESYRSARCAAVRLLPSRPRRVRPGRYPLVVDWLTVSGSARLDLHTPTARSSARASPRWFAATAGPAASRRAPGISRRRRSPKRRRPPGFAADDARPLEAETGKSVSIDVTRVVGRVSLTATLFGSSVANAIEVERERATR